MKDIEFLATGLRIFGWYCLLKFIGSSAEGYISIQQYISMGVDESLTLIYVSTFVPAAMYAISSIVLIKFPICLAKLLIPRSGVESQSVDFSNNNLLYSGCVLLGLYIVSWAIPDLLFNIMMLKQSSGFSLTDTAGHHETIAFTYSTILEIMLGFWLILGSKGIQGVIRRLSR